MRCGAVSARQSPETQGRAEANPRISECRAERDADSGRVAIISYIQLFAGHCTRISSHIICKGLGYRTVNFQKSERDEKDYNLNAGLPEEKTVNEDSL